MTNLLHSVLEPARRPSELRLVSCIVDWRFRHHATDFPPERKNTEWWKTSDCWLMPARSGGTIPLLRWSMPPFAVSRSKTSTSVTAGTMRNLLKLTEQLLRKRIILLIQIKCSLSAIISSYAPFLQGNESASRTAETGVFDRCDGQFGHDF